MCNTFLVQIKVELSIAVLDGVVIVGICTLDLLKEVDYTTWSGRYRLH